MSRRFDIRRVPLGLLFLGSAAVVFGYLLSGYWWLWRVNVAEFTFRALVLIPAASFFGALATLILWYLFRIALPGATRFRRLRMIRYQRSLRQRTNDENTDQAG
jgi:hypothetical protein